MSKKEIIYNKLIRDRIPEIISADGWFPETKVLNKKDFIVELKKKIFEEAKELNEGKDHQNLIEELADIQEIIDTVLKEKQVKLADFRKLQTKKRQKRGGFKKKLFLISTTQGHD